MNIVLGPEHKTVADQTAENAPSPFSWLANRVKRNQQTRIPTQRLYRLSEAACVLNVCVTTLRRRAKSGQLTTIRFGRGWHYITESELRRVSGEERGR